MWITDAYMRLLPPAVQRRPASRRILSYEVASSGEWQPPGSGPAFTPNWFVDISEWDRKREALLAYASGVQPSCPLSRGLEHLADGVVLGCKKQQKHSSCCDR